jgi:hypothetical protein
VCAEGIWLAEGQRPAQGFGLQKATALLNVGIGLQKVWPAALRVCFVGCLNYGLSVWFAIGLGLHMLCGTLRVGSIG